MLIFGKQPSAQELHPQSYYKNIEGVYNLKIFFIYEATPSYLKSDLLQVTSTVLKLQLL